MSVTCEVCRRPCPKVSPCAECYLKCQRCGRTLGCHDGTTSCGDQFACGYRAAMLEAAGEARRRIGLDDVGEEVVSMIAWCEGKAG